MTYRVIVHDEALHDIERNARWWAENHSPTEAARWYEAAFEAIYKLDRFPESHSIAFEGDNFPFEIRELHFGLGSRPSYRAVFTVEGDTVHVLTVRRASQDTFRPDELDYDAEL